MTTKTKRKPAGHHTVKKGELLYGNGCPQFAKSCFECPLPDCKRPDKHAR